MTKIHTKIVLDMNSGAVERDEWYDYDGPLAHCKGGSTTVREAKPTAEELALQRKQVQLAEQQLQIIQNQITQQETQFEAFAPFLEQQTLEFERVTYAKEPMLKHCVRDRSHGAAYRTNARGMDYDDI